ncbi:chorismate mutase [Bacillus timonensis]|uniref:chorismate mutase n=1 Tax=Bacillus timonensis TaxID=1033734 RepID=A0A4S3PYT7_9BACI|nr:chorismate mutase [Bacillus timonensis]THE15089.1 chorismate mutase [Bacillus timonensis]
MIRGIRGATTIENNDKQEILTATEKLLRVMISENKIDAEDVAQIVFSVTDDIDAAFPAAAARQIDGWSFVPVMSMREIPVPGSLPMCIRVMMTVNTAAKQEEIQHIYQGGAIVLRPDLSTVKENN